MCNTVKYFGIFIKNRLLQQHRRNLGGVQGEVKYPSDFFFLRIFLFGYWFEEAQIKK